MLYPSIDELKKRADSRYTLVMIASKRSRDLIDGYPALVDIGNEKPVSIATEEIANDLISYSRKLKQEEESSENDPEAAGEVLSAAEAEQESSEMLFDDSGLEKNSEESVVFPEDSMTEESVSDGESVIEEDTEEPDGITENEES